MKFADNQGDDHALIAILLVLPAVLLGREPQMSCFR